MTKLIQYSAIVAAVLYFVGFVYINDFFRYLGMIGAYTQFTALFLGFFAVRVFRYIIMFESPSRTFVLLILVAAYLILYIPTRLVFVGRLPIFGAVTIPLVPPTLLHLIGSIALLVFLYDTASSVGSSDGCAKLTSGIEAAVVIGIDNSLSSDPAVIDFKKIQDLGRIVFLWKDDNFTYFGQRIEGCSQERETWTMRNDSYRSFVTSRN